MPFALAFAEAFKVRQATMQMYSILYCSSHPFQEEITTPFKLVPLCWINQCWGIIKISNYNMRISTPSSFFHQTVSADDTSRRQCEFDRFHTMPVRSTSKFLRHITNDENALGSGGFGDIYKVCLLINLFPFSLIPLPWMETL